jgi:hypothetical protein
MYELGLDARNAREVTIGPTPTRVRSRAGPLTVSARSDVLTYGAATSDLHWIFAVRRGGSLDGDPPERRLRAVAPRRAEDRRREGLTDVFRLTWEHGVSGQAQVIKGMQQIIHSYTLLQDKEALSETVANVRWLIAAGIRDFQAMLDELGKLQTDLPRNAPAPDEPNHDD